MRWVSAVIFGGGAGLAMFCAAGVAAADTGAGRADAASAVRDGARGAVVDGARGAVADGARGAVADSARATGPQRPPASQQRAEAPQHAASVGRRSVVVNLPQLPVSSGQAFTVSADAVTEAAQGYIDAGGDPADAPRFFFGDLAVGSLERLAAPDATPRQIKDDLGNLTVSGYFGGVWLRDNLRPTDPVPAPQPESAPAADLSASALAIGMFDALAAGLTGAAASGNGWISTGAAHVTVPVLLALYGYNRGYLEYLLENPPAGTPSMKETLSCIGFLGCSSTAFPLDLDTRYDAALAKLDNPASLGWWEMKTWSVLLENATGTGRSVWQTIAGQSGFSPASYQALVDLSSAYLMVSKAAVLSAMLAAADGDADTAAASLRLQAGLWMWSGSYFGGLASSAPVGTIPSIGAPQVGAS